MKSLTVLAIGAHPDDCDISAGGTAALWSAAGHKVNFASVTNGARGHYREEYLRDPEQLVLRRREEAQAACALIGAAYHCLGINDGEVEPNVETLRVMVRLIREVQPDIILCNRPNDYHRDHRYTARLVLDASYMLTVPFFCPEAPHIQQLPVIAYWWDKFREGGAFSADVVVSIEDVWDTKVGMVACHESQVFEWLPYNMGILAEVPEDDRERHAVLGAWLKSRHEEFAEHCQLPSGSPVEAFQISEYGRQLQPDSLRSLFPCSE
jgi:LmbE family N-acetylglucosaminyl deacetylase